MRPPELGRWREVPASVYHGEWDAVNNTRLGWMAKSPLHCRYHEDHPEANVDTRATAFGSAAHCMVLEPEHFESRYVAEPVKREDSIAANYRATKAYKEDCFRASFGVTDDEWMAFVPPLWIMPLHRQAKRVAASVLLFSKRPCSSRLLQDGLLFTP